MKDKDRAKRIKRGIIIALVAFGLIVAGAAIGALTAKKKLELYNIDQVESRLGSNEISSLEGFIWESLQRTQGFDNDKREIVALVRPSSFVITGENGMRNYDFLIDVDEFRATYRVSFALYGEQGFYEAPIVECPSPEQMKYPDTECKGDKTSTLTVTVGRNLPHDFKMPTGESVRVTRSVNEAGEEYLKVRVNNCSNETMVAKVTEAVQKWIKTLGYEPDNYTIKVTEVCDGEI